MKKLFSAVIIFFAILIYWPSPAQADEVGCGFTNLLYPTYLGTDGGTAVCYSSSTQCLGYYFMLSAESDVSIKFTQGGWFINLFKGDDYEPSSAYAWMKPNYSGRLAAGKWGMQACPKANEQFKLVVDATPYSAPSAPPPSAPAKKSNGESCASNAECDSNNCRNWLCCESGRLCCSAHSQCTSGQYCDTNVGYCLIKKSNGVSCGADAMCEAGYCADGVCASVPASWCGDGACNGSEACSSCYSDCGACSVSKKADGESCSSESECAGQWCVHNICRSSHIYCGDGYCDTASDANLKQYYESCSSCSSDCGACDKVIKYLVLRTLSSTIIDKKGGAVQDLNIFYPAEYWMEIAKDASSPQAIKSAEKEIVGLLNKFKLDVKSAKLKIDAGSHALRVNLIYRRYAFPPNSHPEMQGYDGYWILPTVSIGDKVEQGAFCKMDEHKMEVKGQKVLLEGEHTQTLESSSAITILQQQFNQAFTLPKEAVDIRTDEEKCVIGYKLAGEAKVANGEFCNSSKNCLSGNCFKGICCAKGKSCCKPTVQNSCGAKSYCSKEDFSCLPRLANGKTCDSGRACLSDNCGLYKEKNMCCGRGKSCCLENSDCDSDQYCENKKSFNCLAKKKAGEKVSSASECLSNYLAAGKCANPPVIKFLFPTEVTLKKGGSLTLPLSIQNISQFDIALDEKILVSRLPEVIEVENGLLRIYRQTLAPNEVVDTEAEQSESSIDKLVIKAKKSGQGKMVLKFNYVADGRLAVLETEIIVIVSKEHVRAQSEATKLFGRKMIWEEIKNINGREYVFVKPEDDPQFEGSLYNWQQSHAAFSSGVDGLIESASDTLKPELYSFAETVKGLNEAQTPPQITEKTIKSLIPSSLQFGATFTNMIAPFAKQQKEEKYLLKAFGVKNLVFIPDDDENGSFRGYIVAIIKEKGGKIYAIKLGNL